MSSYDGRMFSSDLNAYRNNSIIVVERSIAMFGTVASGAQQVHATQAFLLTNLDICQIQFDNSVYHSGKYRDISLENSTFIHETTTSSDLSAWLEPVIIGNSISVNATLFNPSASSITLQTTTINVRFILYDSTLL